MYSISLKDKKKTNSEFKGHFFGEKAINQIALPKEKAIDQTATLPKNW